jgi:serine/threonine protein kinase
MKPLAPNTLLQNRYLVVQLIGKGGMGEVYLAVDQRLGSAMAVKRTFFNDEDQLKAAFEREAKILAMLRHPVLPKVSDHFIENDIQHLVMEHISGDDLGKRLDDAKQPFPTSWVLFWADQLLDALAYLHGHEPPIIHRDIKPQNLKLTNENHIILLDFGLAKNSIGETRLTTSGTLSGYTPHYASMEQIRGTGTTAQSDIYSLSATLYQLLTNTVPPDALTRADNVLSDMPDSVIPINEINPEVSRAISDVILKGMSMSAERRYKNAREMQTALREANAQVQSAMSAKTEAFIIPDAEMYEQIAALPQSQMKTEQYNVPLVSQPQTDNLTPVATNNDPFSSPETGGNQQPNFDATMQYDGQIFGEKTEFLPNNIAVSTPPHQFVDTQAESFTTNNNEAFDPNVTVPLVSFGNDVIAAQPSNQTEVMNFDFVPPIISETRTENYAEQEVFPPPEVSVPEKPPVVVTPPKKKSSGKIFLILGALLVLGFLGLVAAGAGVYLYNPSLLGITTTTPTPTVEPSPTPTVEISVTPTVEPTNQTNTNTGNSATGNNSVNTDNPVGNTNQNVEVEKTPRPSVDKTPVPVPTSTGKVVTPTQRPTKVPTIEPTKPPTKQPTRDPGKIL